MCRMCGSLPSTDQKHQDRSGERGEFKGDEPYPGIIPHSLERAENAANEDDSKREQISAGLSQTPAPLTDHQ